MRPSTYVAAIFVFSVFGLTGCEDTLAPLAPSAEVGGLSSAEGCRVETISRRCDNVLSVWSASADTTSVRLKPE